MKTASPMNITDRVKRTISGETSSPIPFICRMDFWWRGLGHQNKIPEAYEGMSLSEIHQSIGLGQEEWMSPYSYRYKDLELVITFEGREIRREYEPEISFFPDLWGMIPVEQAGETTTELITPKGRLAYKHRITEESIRSGTTRPQLIGHPIREPDDYKIYEAILENSEFVPHFEAFNKRSEELDGMGTLVPTLNRVPFQSLLIDAIGEIPLFYALYDTPVLVERLLEVVDQQTTDLLDHLADFDAPYVEFVDNLDGSMTNQRLFQKYLIPCYQHYAEILHHQGKKLGSHTDGNLKRLVSLMPECGLDVCESFTPAPITECTFEEAWAAWESGPLIWGGIPSYYLEERVPEDELREYVESLLRLVQGRSIILGIGDAVMPDNLIERVRWIAQQVEGTKP
jgi:uroporphyrinogen-III decarboxylase